MARGSRRLIKDDDDDDIVDLLVLTQSPQPRRARRHVSYIEASDGGENSGTEMDENKPKVEVDDFVTGGNSEILETPEIADNGVDQDVFSDTVPSEPDNVNNDGNFSDNFSDEDEDARPAEMKYRELLASLKSETLEDLSVSRPSSRLKWGIAVPGDDSQKIYVWFDALVNYLTAAGYPNLLSTGKRGIWPANTHIVGKDITRFHCVYWPIFLMAAEVELPKQVLVHSHWLSEGVKMSKSLGNVVDPLGLSAHYGTDPTRFYLMENASISNDCKFSEREIQNSHALLVNKWANICSRVGGQKFDLAQAVKVQKNGGFENIDEIIASVEPVETANKTRELRDKLVHSINTLYGNMDQDMKNYGQMRALQRWWETVELGNEFFQHCEPWRHQGLSPGEDVHQIFAHYAVFLCAEAGRVTSICVSPFMPELASKFLSHWAIPQHRQGQEYCSFGADLAYGEVDTSVANFKVMMKLKK